MRPSSGKTACAARRRWRSRICSSVSTTRGASHRFGLSAAPPSELAARIDVRGEIIGDLGEALEHLSGRIFVELDYADLAGWGAWVDYPIYLPRGHGALRLWGDLAESQGRLTADLALEDLRVRLGRKVPELDLNSLRGRLEGRYKESDWALSGSKVELLAADGTRVAPTDFQAAWKQDGQSGRISGSAGASFLDFAVLRKLAAYMPLDPRSRELLEQYRPAGTGIRIAGQLEQARRCSRALRAQGQLQRSRLAARRLFSGGEGSFRNGRVQRKRRFAGA